MTRSAQMPATAFSGARRVAAGPLIDVAIAVKTAVEQGEPDLLVFDDATGRVIDIDLRGDRTAIASRLGGAGAAGAVDEGEDGATTGPRAREGRRGRPRLGVVSREVTLLPRHWDWLGAQKGGASAALRRLVEDARRKAPGTDPAKAATAAYHAMTTLAGDRPGYEEATRALFAGDMPGFIARMEPWPADVRAYVARLAQPGSCKGQST